MPYRNPDNKRDWDLRNRPEKAKRFREAADWADFQILTLKKLGVEHTRSDWARLRSELVKQFLMDSYGLGIDAGNPQNSSIPPDPQ